MDAEAFTNLMDFVFQATHTAVMILVPISIAVIGWIVNSLMKLWGALREHEASINLHTNPELTKSLIEGLRGQIKSLEKMVDRLYEEIKEIRSKLL